MDLNPIHPDPEIGKALLHELGHVLLAEAGDDEIDALIELAVEADGGVTDYDGHGDGEGREDDDRDAAAEMFAEAFRWWWAAPPGDFRVQYPAWTEAIEAVLQAVRG